MLSRIPKLSVLQDKRALAISIGLGAVLWFVALSGWLLVRPNSIMMKRQNVLFGSDTSAWVQRVTGEERPRLVAIGVFFHSLESFLWRPACRALYFLLRIFWPTEYAAVYAARLLVAIIAGIGVGCLAYLAVCKGIEKMQCILLFMMYLLFTANTVAALPEHWGLSNGLLSGAFVVPFVFSSAQLCRIILLPLVILSGGTTITNGLFPLASLAQLSFKSTRSKIAVSTGAVLGLAGITIILTRLSYSIHATISYYANNRLLRDPFQAGMYTVLSWVYPAIGPAPHVKLIPGVNMVSYEPLKITDYSSIQLLGAAAWVVLLLRCVFKAFQAKEARPYVWLLLSWILFNATLHNIWGDEFFIYSPHWSWALMGLVILGARDLSWRFTATMVVPLMMAQIDTLLKMRSALQSISQ